jgi:signal transduction histidine kinase
VLYGPFELVQGGAGFALRVPIQVEAAGATRVWGLSSAIVRLHVMLKRSRIPPLQEAGYDYQLSRIDPGRQDALLASSRPGGPSMEDPAVVRIELPGQTWKLGIAPRGGWGAASSLGMPRLAVLLISLLAATLAYRILSLPETLRREVEARTAELQQAHREQRRAEEAQRHSQKLEAIGLLAGGVAHDFNNVLAGILGYAELLAVDAVPGGLVEEAAQTISQAAQRGAQLTRQLLAFARLDHPRQVDVDLHVLVGEVTTLLARTFEKSIRVETHLAAPRHHVRGDPGQLQQVLLNLTVNGRDAMPEGGTLTIETAVEDLDEPNVARGLLAGRYLVL